MAQAAEVGAVLAPCSTPDTAYARPVTMSRRPAIAQSIMTTFAIAWTTSVQLGPGRRVGVSSAGEESLVMLALGSQFLCTLIDLKPARRLRPEERSARRSK
jgi:hypothetical protein